MNNYGGKGKFELPKTHKAAMRVPKGGSCCLNCAFLRVGHINYECSNKYWIQWNGGNAELPLPPDEYCSDWYEPVTTNKPKQSILEKTFTLKDKVE